MDRVDLRVVMQASTTGTYDAEVGESSEVVRERVAAARSAAALRWYEHGCLTNNEVPGPLLRREFRLPRRSSARSRMPCGVAGSPPEEPTER